MNTFAPSNPLIRQGWLRAMLYAIPFAVLAVFISMQGPAEFISGPLQPKFYGLVFALAAILITYIFRQLIDRKSFMSLGLSINGYWRDAIAGGMLAVFIVAAASLILKATDHLKWTDIIFDPRNLFIILGSTILTAFGEELVFRGYILSNLMESFNKWLALLISALLFMLFHWSSIGFLPLLNTFIIGLVLGLTYIYTRNLWFPICFHIGWKFFEAPILGFPVEGGQQTLLQADINGDANITGGTAGLEGSFVFTVIALMSLVALYLFFQRKINLQSQPVPGRI
jgi:membrane protease YdiL (CAAX protease family)